MDRRTFLALPAAAFAAPVIEDGFTPMFDGTTLRGWSVREGPESAFYVKDGAITVHEGANFPTWLRSDRQYENFDFRCEYFIKGWMNSGLYFHAPEHGRNTWCGFKVNIFQKQDQKMLRESVGAIFPLIPPQKVNVRNRGEWNSMRVLVDWPKLQVWSNDELVQDLNMETAPDMRWRLRRGYIGIESLSYPIQFRNLRVKELPGKEKWQTLYESPADFANWEITEGKPKYETLGPVLRGDGLGYLASRERFRDFELQMYIRASLHSNGGIIFRADGPGNQARHYEIQLHDVEGAVYPTGSLYGFKRASYPHIAPEQWYLFQLFVKGKDCVVRINGENVVEYADLQDLQPGKIMLQAHQLGRWIEYKQIRIKDL